MLVENKRLFCYAFLWGIPLAISCVLGWRLVHEGTVFGGGGSAAAYVGSFLLFLLETAVLSVPSAAFAAVVLRGGIRKCRGRSPGFASGKAAAGTCGMAFGKTQRMGNAVAGKESPAVGYIAESSRVRRPAWQIWIFYSLLICFCWLPIFLAYYPSVFAYDAEGQLYQVLASDYSTHHPLLHTLFLGAFFRLGIALGSCSVGMAVHSAVQMALMACAFGWALSFLYQRRVSGLARMLLFLFFAFFPANSVLAVSTTKDVLFAALVLIYTLWLYRMVCGGNAGSGWSAADAMSVRGKAVRGRRSADGKEIAACMFWAVLMLLFRNNAVYALAVSVPIVYIGLGGRKRGEERGAREVGQQSGEEVRNRKAEAGNRDEAQGVEPVERSAARGGLARKRYLYMSLLTLVLYGICASSLKAATHAQDGSPREMLSVPLQQMARVRVKAEEKLDPSVRQELEKYIPSAWVFAAYNPHLADPVKNRAVIHDDPAGLIKTWIRLGTEHPAIYIDAFLDNSLGLWYLWDTSHAQVYGIGTESGFGYLSTDNRTMPAGFEVEENSRLPGLRAFMERIVSDNAYGKAPVVRLLFAPALYWWLLYLYIVAAFYKRRYGETLPTVFLAAYCLTLLLSPTVLVRYIYPLMVTIPVIMPCLMTDVAQAGSENTQ